MARRTTPAEPYTFDLAEGLLAFRWSATVEELRRRWPSAAIEVDDNGVLRADRIALSATDGLPGFSVQLHLAPKTRGAPASLVQIDLELASEDGQETVSALLLRLGSNPKPETLRAGGDWAGPAGVELSLRVEADLWTLSASHRTSDAACGYAFETVGETLVRSLEGAPPRAATRRLLEWLESSPAVNSPASVTKVVQALAKPSLSRSDAVDLGRAIARLATDEVIDSLRSALEAQGPEATQGVLEGMARRFSAWPRITTPIPGWWAPFVRATATSRIPALRAAAISLLGHLGDSAEPQLEAQLSSPDLKIRLAAAEGYLSRTPEEARAVAEKLSGEKGARMREARARLLCSAYEGGSLELAMEVKLGLVQLLGDPEVFPVAFVALCRRGDLLDSEALIGAIERRAQAEGEVHPHVLEAIAVWSDRPEVRLAFQRWSAARKTTALAAAAKAWLKRRPQLATSTSKPRAAGRARR
jgi:hypothetical protein